GEGRVNAMYQVRGMYQTFADDSADKHLNFNGYSPPQEWHKVDDPEADEADKQEYSTGLLAMNCPMHAAGFGCAKMEDESVNIITGRFVSERRWGICK